MKLKIYSILIAIIMLATFVSSCYSQKQQDNSPPSEIINVISVLKISDENAGKWEKLPNGKSVWKASCLVTQTETLQQEIQKLAIPQNSEFNIYDYSMTLLYSSSAVDNSKFLISDVLSGNVVFLEYIKPLAESKRISEERIIDPQVLNEKKALRSDVILMSPEKKAVEKK